MCYIFNVHESNDSLYNSKYNFSDTELVSGFNYYVLSLNRSTYTDSFPAVKS